MKNLRYRMSLARLRPQVLFFAFGLLGIHGVFSEAIAAAPNCDGAYASPGDLWPPNHKFASIDILGVENDDGTGAANVVIQCIRQDEPLNSNGDGNTQTDARGIGGAQAEVLKERQGGGNGRVYHIDFSATNTIGESCRGTATVGVPHSKKAPVVDEGPLFESTPDNLSCGGEVNSPPEAVSQTLETGMGDSLDIVLAATDADADSLAFAVLSGPSNGTLVGDAPDIVYTPNAAFVGTDTFTFNASDGQSPSIPATVTIDVVVQNIAPVAEAQSLATTKDGSVDIVLAGSDADGDNLSYRVVDSPVSGTLSGIAPTLLYTPNADFSGIDEFSFDVNDGVAISDKAYVTIEVLASNNPPVALPQSVETTNDPNQVIGITLEGTDADGDDLSYALVEQPLHGSLEGIPPALTYRANPEYVGQDSFRFYVSDEDAVSAEARVTIDVAQANRPPIANAGVDQETVVGTDIIVTGSGSDPDGDQITYGWSFVSVPAASLITTTDTSSAEVSFVPDAAGEYVLSLTVSDGTLTSTPDLIAISVSEGVANRPPVAVISMSDETFEPGEIVVVGAGSDPDGDPISSYAWSLVEKPDGSSAELLATDTSDVRFVADVEGAYQLELVVSDGQDVSAPDAVSINVVAAVTNQAPTAVITVDELASSSDIFELSAFGSSDPEGDLLSFRWEIVSPEQGPFPAPGQPELVESFPPDGVSVTLIRGSTPVDVIVELVANDGQLDSLPVTKTFPALSSSAPQPVITLSQNGREVSFHGLESISPTGAPLNYLWAIVPPGGDPLLGGLIDDERSPTPQFLGKYVGEYEVTLSVWEGASLPVSTSTTFILPRGDQPNRRPVLADSPDFQETGGSSYPRDNWRRYTFGTVEVTPRNFVTGEDDDGPLPLTYDVQYVEQPEGANIVPQAGTERIQTSGLVGLPVVDIDLGLIGQQVMALDDPALAPSGDYEAQVTAFDGELYSEPLVYRFTLDRSPRLKTDPEITFLAPRFERLINEPFEMNLAGTLDPEGGELTYEWSVSSRPAGSVAELDIDGTRGVLVADVGGLYDITVVVTDDFGNTVQKTFRLNASGILFPSARAEAGQDRSTTTGRVTPLNSNGSRGRRADALLSYAWTIIDAPSGSEIPTQLDAAAISSFVPDVPGAYVVELTVTDEDAASTATDTVTITAEQNGVPIARIDGPSVPIVIGDAVTLDGAGSSDPDGDSLTYLWTLTNAPAESALDLSEQTNRELTLAPDVPGEFVFELVVTDESQGSGSAMFTLQAVSAPPIVAIAQISNPVDVGSLVTLDGRESTDPAGDALTYAWALISSPEGSSSAITDTNAGITDFSPDTAGDYTIELLVSGSGGAQATASVTVTAIDARPDNRAPVVSTGYDRKLVEQTHVSLMSGFTFDPDGDVLSYSWRIDSQPSNSLAEIDDPSSDFTSALLDKPGTYQLTLDVSDGLLTSSDSFTVQVVAGNDTLPEDPGSFGTQGLYGVDENANDVRDDVERFIFANYSSDPQLVRALNQLAKSMNTAFTYRVRDDLKGEMLRTVNAAYECLAAVTNGDPGDAGTIVVAETVNSDERYDAYREVGEWISGSILVGNPIDVWMNSCEDDGQ